MAARHKAFRYEGPSNRNIWTIFSRLQAADRLLMVILVLQLVLGVFYSVTIPIGESYDEWPHFRYAEYVATERQLPPNDLDLSVDTTESYQPPLYYLITGLAISPFATKGTPIPAVNWLMDALNGGLGRGGYNFLFHTYDEAFPYQGVYLTMHIARLVTLLMAILTVFMTYRIGRLLFPDRAEIALSAAAVNAFIPQFMFMGAVVSNDIAPAMVGAFALFFMLRIIVSKVQPLDVVLLWLTTILAILAKYHALSFVPLALFALALAVKRGLLQRSAIKPLAMGAVPVLGAGVALILWDLDKSNHIAHPVTLTKEVYQLASVFTGGHGSATAFDWSTLPATLWFAFSSFWLRFGYGSIGADQWVYQALAVVCALALVGLVVYTVKEQRSTHRLAISVLAAAVVLTTVLAYELLMSGGLPRVNGRRLLTVAPAIALLLVVGLTSLVPRRMSRHVATGIAALMFIFTAVAPFAYILPAYPTGVFVTEKDIPSSLQPLHVTFGGAMELIGYEMGSPVLADKSVLPVTLYWRSLARVNENYKVGVKVVGDDGLVYGHTFSYPGQDYSATSNWKPGDIIRDVHNVQVDSALRAIPRYMSGHVLVVMVRVPSYEELDAVDPHGQSLGGGVPFARLKLVPPEKGVGAIPNATAYDLGGKISLLGYAVSAPSISVGETLTVTLYWRAADTPTEDYTVFVHLSDDKDNVPAQQDRQPVRALYPTSLWEKGEVIADEHEITVPGNLAPGDYHLFVGMYSLATQKRLPASDAQGIHVKDDKIPLSTVRVQAP